MNWIILTPEQVPAIEGQIGPYRAIELAALANGDFAVPESLLGCAWLPEERRAILELCPRIPGEEIEWATVDEG